MGDPTQVWMPQDNAGQDRRRARACRRPRPQLYLSTLTNASCCSVSEMFVVAYDPQTDFTIQPWLKEKLGQGLKLGEAVGGTYVFVPEGEQNIKLYGYLMTLKANLEPTGTGLDQSMFLTFETAHDIARISQTHGREAAGDPRRQHLGGAGQGGAGRRPARGGAARSCSDVPGVTPIESPNLFQAYRKQMTGLLASRAGRSWAITLALSVLLIGLVFSMAANERRRELGVLRALGATRGFVFRSLLAEAGLLALAGGLAGIALTMLVDLPVPPG